MAPTTITKFEQVSKLVIRGGNLAWLKPECAWPDYRGLWPTYKEIKWD